jgi:hypothetical protein
MPYFREQDKKTRDRSWSDEARAVLVLAIQTIDEECFKQIQDDKTPLGNLRHRLDLILNSNHWNDKRMDEREARNEPAWRAAQERQNVEKGSK